MEPRFREGDDEGDFYFLGGVTHPWILFAHPVQLFTNFANSRRDRDSVIRNAPVF